MRKLYDITDVKWLFDPSEVQEVKYSKFYDRYVIVFKDDSEVNISEGVLPLLQEYIPEHFAFKIIEEEEEPPF